MICIGRKDYLFRRVRAGISESRPKVGIATACCSLSIEIPINSGFALLFLRPGIFAGCPYLVITGGLGWCFGFEPMDLVRAYDGQHSPPNQVRRLYF